MPSSFKWVDFTEDDQRRIREILYLFRDREIREELGLGTIRDAFADILFPGTSTLHTRAKYLLFVPWLFIRLEKKEVTSANISQELRKEELNLSKALLDAGETDGVIGRLAGAELKILPSYMYWTALGTYGKSWGQVLDREFFQDIMVGPRMHFILPHAAAYIRSRSLNQ